MVSAQGALRFDAAGRAGARARWASERGRTEGRATEWVRIGDSGGKATFCICPTCGATVYYQIDDMSGVIAVPVGNFADPGFPPRSSRSTRRGSMRGSGCPRISSTGTRAAKVSPGSPYSQAL